MIRPSRSRLHSTVIALAVATLTVAGAAAVVASTTTAQAAVGVEDDGADCPVSLPGSLTANAKLPDPFLKLDGTRISTTSQWRCRRAEIKKLSERYVYGEKPGKPQTVTGTVTSSRITVNVSHNGRSSTFSAGVQLPSGNGPFPAVVVLGGIGADTATIRASGAAVINYDPYAVGKEGTPRGSSRARTTCRSTHTKWSAWSAPRGLFIMENPSINHLAPRSGSVAALAGAEIYKALGAGENITYWSDVQSGSHCANRPEWRTPLQQNIQKFLLKTGNAPGTIRISSKAAGNLSQWRDWTTPTLSNSGPPSTTASPSPPASSTPTPGVSPSQTTSGPGGCSTSVSVNQWNGGFVATFTVTAGSSPINNWRVAETLPSGANIANTWNAQPSGTTGNVTFTNVSHNGQLAAGQSTTFGFQGTGTGTGLNPTCTTP